MDTTLPEELARQAGSLRRLALRLVEDEASADDVVQETWLVVLRQEQRARSNPLGWLAGIARNVAHKLAREDARRRHREGRAARPGFAPSPEEVAEGARLQREMTDLVLGLDEPYRTALLYRYFEDMPPRAIAREMGAKTTTVDAWLLRGRERIRRKLTARHGSASLWCGALLAWAATRRYVGVSVVPAAAVAIASIAAVGATFVTVRSLTSDSGAGLEDRRALGAPEVDRSLAGLELPTEARRPHVDPEATTGEARFVPEVSPALAAEVEDSEEPEDRGSLLASTGPPPGLRLVEGGPTVIGTTVEEVLEFVRERPQFANTFAGETPRHEREVADFYLMPTEVTNEQYEAFVRATDHRPPHTWGAQAIERGRSRFEEDEARERGAALAAGMPWTTREWDPVAWWDEHWQESPWSVPEEIRRDPVTDVSFEDARTYARWAGLRLMTELEFQRACRRDTERRYPWGDTWDSSLCNALDSAGSGVRPAGTLPAGACQGIHDLVGNVWEWTDSKYTKFEGYRPLKLEVDGATHEGLAGFDPTMRVLAGGSFVNYAFASRISSRMPAERRQRTEAVGFRCAAGGATAWAGIRDEVEEWLGPTARRTRGANQLSFDASTPTVLARWVYSPGTVRVDSYAVIEGFERTFFLPTDSIPASTPDELRQDCLRRGVVQLGVLALHRRSLDPELEAGMYVVGLGAASSGSERVVLLDAGGASRAELVPTAGPEFEHVDPQLLGAVRFEDGPSRDLLLLTLAVRAPGGRSLRLGLSLALDPSAFDATWR